MRTAQRRSNTQRLDRAGVTLLDVLVSISITLTVAALLFPAINHSRPTSKRAECLNNMKQLVLSERNFADRHHGQLTWLCEKYGSHADNSVLAPWTYALLPDLDNAGMLREFLENPRAFQNGNPILLKVLQCPATYETPEFGALSYVANAGYIRADIYSQTAPDWMLAHSLTAVDWNQNGTIDNDDLQIAFSTGAFWPRIPDSQAESDEEKLALLKRPLTLDYIESHVGQQHTILFAENKQARNWQRADALHDFAFGVPVNPAKDFADAAQGQPLDFTADFGTALMLQNAMLNSNPIAKPCTAARPSSNHLGVSIYGFADGAARMISDDIDWSVYVRLLTPNGQEYGHSEQGIDEY